MTTNKIILILPVLALIMSACLLAASPVAAMTPTLTLTTTSDGDTVELTAVGDANANVIFYYTKTGSGLQINYLGKTNSSGSFTVNLSKAAYNITDNSVVYVLVNNLKSNEAAWPYLAAASVLTLNQTSVVLPLGQSTALTAYNNGTNVIYLSNNSNPPVANVNISGNQITISALNYGSSLVTVCAGTGTSPSCASAYVTVQNTGAKAITFSQSSATVAPDSNIAVKVLGGTGTYALLSNSNAGVIRASLSGSTVSLSTSNSSGSAAITVCSSDMSSCGVINAVVGNVSSSGLTFSQVDPTMSIGQTLTITISGGIGGNYSIFSNSNTTAVQATLSDTTLTLYGNAGGVSTVTVCSSMGSCAAEVVTVNYNLTTGGGSIALSQNNLWLMAGQSSSLTVSGGSKPYGVSGYSESILKAKFEDNVLTVTGVSAGSASVNVCSAGGGCVILSVLVNGTTSSTATLSLSQSKLALVAGKSGSITISGNGTYFMAYNTNNSVATVSISGNSATVNALAVGTTDISICQNGGQCAVLGITVSGTDTAPTTTTDDWTSCANEKAQCNFSGSKTVRYGSGGKYYYGTFSAGVFCSNSIFGDPIENVAKQCSYGGVIPSGSKIISAPTADASGWTTCSAEKAQCQFSGYQTVRYGANNKYFYGSYLNSVLCSNATFGDPIENVVKQCSYGGTIPSDATIETPTSDNTGESTAKTKFTQTLAYGATGASVKALQQRLKDEGFYGGAIDGKFLTSTVVAVKAFQKKHGIKQTGNMGAMTMAELNK